ncbi:Hypothetical predicted protein [Paramuricea clavata]|uniref:Uncharacterized protein n=1 Tax=Paramuricea clavata TaxID=317549 RepID=A0A6S7GUY2_PARCT|nr:Hypothetical predicted protein [Paramuricea clavata]
MADPWTKCCQLGGQIELSSQNRQIASNSRKRSVFNCRGVHLPKLRRQELQFERFIYVSRDNKIMEEREKTEQNNRDQSHDQERTQPASSDTNLSDVVGQMPSRVANVACAAIQRRPTQTDQTFMTPQEIGLILRQIGDEMDKLASGGTGNRTEKRG